MVSFARTLCFAALVPLASSPASAQPAEQPQPAPTQQVDPASAASQTSQTAQQGQAAPCPAPGTKIEVEQESTLAKETGAAAGGTAAQIAAGAALGPIGAAVAAVVGAAAGKKAGGTVKKKKEVDVAEVRPECAQVAAQSQEAEPASPGHAVAQKQ